MGDFYRDMTQRTELVLGAAGVASLARARVILFGLGGVGSWCAEALLRSGILDLTLVDSDVVAVTNLNRQLQATSLNLGEPKADELRDRLLSINPAARIVAISEAFTPETKARFGIECFDYVVDAIDSISNKILLIETCLRLGKKIVSSMGAGARSDPFQVRVDKLSKTINCGLARAVRKGLRRDKVRSDSLCVYSREIPAEPAAPQPDLSSAAATDWSLGKKRINGALAHVTGTFGFALAGLVIRDVAGIEAIPVRLQKD
jgi:tRNA threonylcarbamoyladenosine dehydratase